MDYVCRAGPFAARIGQGGRWPANGGNRPSRAVFRVRPGADAMPGAKEIRNTYHQYTIRCPIKLLTVNFLFPDFYE
jgi:hypothetical protein